MKCDNCGTHVRIRGGDERARCEIRDADECGPSGFLIIDGGWLVHRCTIVEPTERRTAPESDARLLPTPEWRSLTPTEHRVVDLVATGMTNAEIARCMYVSVNTVKTHVAHVFNKLNVSNRAELAARATRIRTQ